MLRQCGLPRFQNARDLLLRGFAKLRRGDLAREVHRKLFAQVRESGMHFGRIGTRHRPAAGIGGPEPRFGMALGKCLANGKAIPYGRRPSVFLDLQNGHASGWGVFLNLLFRGGAFRLAQLNNRLFERRAGRAQREIRPQGPARPILRSHNECVMRGHAASIARADAAF